MGRRRNGQLREVLAARAGRHADGTEPPAVKITDRLSVVGGLWRQYSPESGAYWWSADGNDYHASAEAARLARVTS